MILKTDVLAVGAAKIDSELRDENKIDFKAKPGLLEEEKRKKEKREREMVWSLV